MLEGDPNDIEDRPVLETLSSEAFIRAISAISGQNLIPDLS